ncbi:MAG TPA: SURF1 family cytochrome oxidase biogenesis protein [Allosphingosinicella sp.]|nr:SURF1 family cytochrome oxidase biogenesis protein [Allosphingosinicella sp.]
MNRLPLLPTLIVAAAVAAMIGLGVWQLQRAEWKEGLIAEYKAAAQLPPLDLDPLLESGSGGTATLPPLAFRRVTVTCQARQLAPQLRGGRSRDGAGGYSYFLPCRPGSDGLAGRLFVNAGWSAMPHEELRLSALGPTSGRLGAVEGDRIVLTRAEAPEPLLPSAESGIENISNNHFLYALQWFFFAAAAALIYGLALRRRGRETLPPKP